MIRELNFHMRVNQIEPGMKMIDVMRIMGDTTADEEPPVRSELEARLAGILYGIRFENRYRTHPEGYGVRQYRSDFRNFSVTYDNGIVTDAIFLPYNDHQFRRRSVRYGSYGSTEVAPAPRETRTSP
jgi:hypothetical protein